MVFTELKNMKAETGFLKPCKIESIKVKVNSKYLP